ncbi:MAG TPA: DUF1707 domain-containing protein [Streptosporangiaceae bacterium]|jgi:hypothetical protein|nr:DUF1707 domain-containing protein [Streptosporangiaceae bacterium]
MPGSAPAGPRRLAGEADRERLVVLLREHYALGQLDDDELDRRVGVVLGARYMDEATSAVTDLPQLAAPGAAAGRPARQRRGHAQAAKPAAGWIPTDERFRDPTTRAVMRVWIDPADQSRHYVPEPGA